tara:strand:+ start:2544 stop:3452 length:909 start_codon:yes stop_codon:yes gene_type:complete
MLKRKYKNLPLISIIINCYNGEKYLKEAINSVLKQTYKNWEIIFWNNKSVDNSEKIVKNFKDKRIKYFKSKKFLKLYEARNLAIKKAKGDFIAFLDVDDFWSHAKLAKQINVFKKNKKLGLVYSNCFILRNEGKTVKKFVKSTLPNGRITQDLLDNYRLPILTVLIKKSFFKKQSFEKKYEIIGDFDFFLNLSLKNEFGCVQEPLASYRIHDSNISRKKIGLFIKELENWVSKNQNLKKMKDYSINGIFLQIQLLKIKRYILNKLRFKMFLEIFKHPLNYKKLKFLPLIILPSFIINKIFSF